MRRIILQPLLAVLLCMNANAQINSGSNGSDGAFNPATSVVINMADHTNGIYQYTSVTISNGITVKFTPNANNTPVTWLVQSNVVINGVVDVSGQPSYQYPSTISGIGGVGGGAGGGGGSNPSFGQGLGGGSSGSGAAGGGSFGTQGSEGSGQTYGNSFLIPLIGGSGGGGVSELYINGGIRPSGGGGGGGGAILIAASNFITINAGGNISANGGNAGYGGGGSGGGIRLFTATLTGAGGIYAIGGGGGGSGRVRIDALQNNFSGTINGVFTQGFQPIIIPVAGQGVQLSIASVAGAAVSSTPNGQLLSPDAIISGQQANPIPVVVSCANLPLHTLITVTVKPASGASVSAVGYNTTGTLASSTATVSLTMPRGGGIIYATAATSN